MPTARSSGGPAAAEARGLVKLFGSTPALIKVDLRVPPGSVCAMVGENGAGKTTLLRIFATALRPTAGTALVYGHDVRRHGRAARLAVDLVSGGGGLYPELSASENLVFAVRMRGLRPSTVELRRALERVGLARDAAAPAQALSAGMARRLCLARLLLTKPGLALLDEPYASLDEDGRALADEIVEQIRADGRAALLATHERRRARALADLVVALRRGVLVEPGDEAVGGRAVLAPAQLGPTR